MTGAVAGPGCGETGDSRGKWCGNYNGHSTLWWCDRADSNGLIREEFIEDKGLVCVNDDRGTRYNDTEHTPDSGIKWNCMHHNMGGV